MAARVNTKFVTTLIVVLLALVGGLSCYYYFVLRVSPGQLVSRGDDYMAKGLTDKAIEEYGQALRQEPNNFELMMKYVHTLEQAKTSDPRTATKYLKLIVGLLHKANTHRPGDTEPFEQLMQVYLRLGRDLGDFESWSQMHEESNRRLAGSPSPEMETMAKKYRAIARVNRMERLDVPPDERLETREDLEQVLEQSPEDRDVTYYLAAWHFLEAEAIKRTGGRDQAVKRHLAEADRLSAESLGNYPDDTRRQVDRLRVLGLLERAESEESLSLANKIEQSLLENPSSLRLILEMVELLPKIDKKEVKTDSGARATTAGVIRAEQLLRTALEANPSEARYIATLARVLEIQHRDEEALELYEQVFEQHPTTNAFDGVQLDRLQAGAMLKFADIKLQGLDSLALPQRQKTIEEVDTVVKRVASNHGETPQVNLLQGKIALAQNQWGQASAYLDRANAQFNNSVPEALLLAARAWTQMGELGAATDKLEQLARLRPDYTPAHYELVRLYLQLNQHTKAQRHLGVILAEKPDDPRALRLKANLLSQMGQTEEAIDTYLALNPAENPDLIPTLANLYLTAGQTETAMQLLEDRFKQDPKDIETLQSLVRVSQDVKQAMGYLNAARQAGADTKALDLLESRFEGQSEFTDVLSELIDTEEVPFRRHMKRYYLYQRMGKWDDADQELEQAARLEPESAMVISAKFDRALAKREWPTAESLAAQAATKNLDMAEGVFFQGRLEAQQGHYERAIASYRRALTIRKTYSEGWRQLGDVLRLISDWSEAAESYQKAVDQRPNNVLALTGLAISQNAMDQHTLALANFRKAADFAPNDPTLQRRYLAYEEQHGNIQRAMALRQQRAATDPKDLGNRRALAMLLARAGQQQEAQRVIDQLLKQTEESRANMGAAAVVRNLAGDPDGAQQLLMDYVRGLGEKAVDEDWMLLARFLLELGLEDQAKASYRQAIAVEDPQLRRATREFADLLFDRGEYEEAVERYSKLWETSPDERRVGYRFVEALLRVNDPDRAQKILDTTNSKHPVNTSTHVLQGLIHRARGDKSAALEEFDKAIALDPHRAVIYYQRADLQASDRQLESSVMADLNQSLELDPDLGAARRLLATIYVRRGQREEAISELVMLLRRNPRHIAARLQLAGLYMDDGRWEQRKRLLEESAKLFPRAAIWPQLQAQQALIDSNESLAIKKLVEAFKMSPSPQTLGELSALLIQTNEPKKALDLLRGHAEIVRTVPLLHALRGRALAALGDDDLAVRAFTRAAERCSVFTDLATISIQITKAFGVPRTISLLESWAQGERSGAFELAIVQLEIESAQYDAAMQRLKRIDILVPEVSPERLQYYRLLALAHYQLEQYEEALSVYHKLLDAQPNNLITLNNAAYLLAEDLARAEEAVPLAQRASELAPDNPLVLDTLGWAMFKVGRSDVAMRVLQRSVGIKPSALNCLHLATVMTESGRGSREETMRILTQAKTLAEQSGDQDTLWLITKRLEQFNQN